jgi:hypothetical protein
MISPDAVRSEHRGNVVSDVSFQVSGVAGSIDLLRAQHRVVTDSVCFLIKRRKRN